MSRVLRVTVDPTSASLAETIAAAAPHVPLLVLTGRMFIDLAAELGGDDAATRHLLAVAESVDTPVAVNFATDAEASTTAMIAPRSWTRERLRGWIGGKHEILTAMFGEATIREDV
jgi:hypothetical protein